ncbi:hypothetical protein [Porphyromonas gingivalis]|uniref:hypothetical protein n=1 Tax=Porphyromonas gingivalis TaxID=837 RepID=UPI00041C15F9|nr:hypothetical protein [Porphyromonas gingivalis]
MNRIAEFIVKKRLAIITAGVAITLILGYFSTKLTINSILCPTYPMMIGKLCCLSERTAYMPQEISS